MPDADSGGDPDPMSNSWDALFARAAAFDVDESTIVETLRRHREGDDG